MRLLRLQQALSLVMCVSALAVRDSTLNETTTPTEIATPIAVATPIETTTPTEPETPIEDPDEEPFPTQSRQMRPHPEATQTDGFGSGPCTSSTGCEDTKMTAPPDIGSVIKSYLTRTLTAVPSIQTERPESGWEAVTQSRPFETPTPAAGPHWELSTDGFGQVTTRQVPAAPGLPRPATTEDKPRPVVTPPPVITQGSITFTPVPVTSVRVTSIDGKPTTLGTTVNYQYVVGTATIPINSPTVINNVPIAISIDGKGSTIFIAEGQSTTVAPPAQAAQAMSISTTVIDGTTKYVIAGQTLAPNQAITVGDVPISIGANGQSTVLVMGNLTTTFAATTTTEGVDAAATRAATGQGTAKSGAASAHNQRLVLAKIIAVAAAVRPFM